MYSQASAEEKLAAAVAEAAFEINGTPVFVGGNSSSTSAAARFTFAGFRVSNATTAGNFTFVPGARGSRAAKRWPPPGVRVAFDHALACSAVGAGAGGAVTATVAYELYDGTSAFSKWIQLSHACSEPLFVFNMTASMLALLADGSVETYTDAAISEGAVVALDAQPYVWVNRFLPITASHSYDAVIPSFGPGLSFFAAGDVFESYMVVEVVHDAPYPTPSGQRGFSRYGLESSRMWRTLAPQTEQFPIAANAVCVGGASLPPGDPSAGGWCYDADGTAALQAFIDQAVSLGFELLTVSLNMNQTWRSSVGVEFQSLTNTSWFAALVNRSRAGGVELGAYQLLRNARSATGINECAPSNAFFLSGDGFDDMDVPAPGGTGLPCHNGGNAQCTGGPGCCSLCAANEWYDAMGASVQAFWRATGMTATEQDGAESNSPCANASHAGHHGLNDSVWQKWRAVHDTFHGYLSLPASTGSWPGVGWVHGMPGHWLQGGQAKVPGGYDEMTWSLPVWTWLARQRERMIHDPQQRDMVEPNALRYFVTPFTPYHPVQPSADGGSWETVTGLQSVATLEPLEDRTLELEWALSQTYGTGIFSNLRGWRLSGGPLSAAVVSKWVAFAKRYRTVLVTDFVTLQCGTVCWGAGATMPGSTCTVSSWDAILHRAPDGFYPDIAERALAVVWNPLNATTAVNNLTLPLYFAGFAAGDAAAVRQEEGAPVTLTADANSTVAVSPFTMPPLTVTYFIVERG